MSASSRVKFSLSIVGAVSKSERFMALVKGVSGSVVPEGFVYPMTGQRNNEEYWSYETDYIETDDVGSTFKKTFAWLITVSDEFADLAKRQEFDFFFDFAVKLNSENLPAFLLDRGVIGLVASLNAEIEIDLYQI